MISPVAHPLRTHAYALALMLGVGSLIAARGTASLAAPAREPHAAPAEPAPAPTKRLLRKVGAYTEPGWQPRASLAVVGSTAFVAGSEHGIHVLDVSDPRLPKNVATVLPEHDFVEIVADGTRLFARERVDSPDVERFQLLIVDVADPRTSRIVGQMAVEGMQEMVVDGDYLYYATSGEGSPAEIVVLDVRNPSAPGRVGAFKSTNPGESITELQVAHGVAFFLSTSQSAPEPRLSVVDLSNPQAPRQLGSVATLRGQRLRLDGTVAIVAGDGVEMIDVRDPGAMRRLASFEDPDLSDINQLAVSGGLAYIPFYGTRIVALDFSSGRELAPLAPTWIAKSVGVEIEASLAVDSRAYFLVSDFGTPDDPSLVIAEVQVGPGCPNVGPAPTPTPIVQRAVPGTRSDAVLGDVPEHLDLKRLALWGGAGSAVAVLANGIVYEGEGARLYARQLNGTATPTVLGSIGLDGAVQGLAVADGVAWVTTGGNSLWAYDVRDPHQVRLLGHADRLERAAQVVVDAGMVYVVEGSGLSIVDGTDATRPKMLGQLSDEDNFTRIAVWGGYIYAHSEWSTGLAIIDATDPAHPSRVARLADGRQVTRIAVSDKRLYMVLADPSTLWVRDLSTPEKPTELATFSLGASDSVSGMLARGELLVIADAPMWIMSVRDPRNPVVVTRYDHPATVASLAIDGQNLLLVDEPDDMLSGIGVATHVLDMTDPAAPGRKATWHPAGVVADVAVDGNTAYLNLLDGVRALDVTDPGAPRTLGDVGGSAVRDDFGRVLFDGSHLYRTADWRLSMFDVADPHNIHELSALRHTFSDDADPDEDTRVRDVAGGNGRLYAAVADYGLAVIDVTDPTFPSPLGSLVRPLIKHVALDGDRAAIVDWTSDGWRMTLVDVTDPCALRVLGEYVTGIYEPQVALTGDTAYVWGEAERAGSVLEIIDVSTPSAPRLAHTLAVPEAYALTLADGLVWLAGPRMLVAIDASDRNKPRTVATYTLPGAASGLAVAGDTVYVALNERGLLTLRMKAGEAVQPVYLPALAQP